MGLPVLGEGLRVLREARAPRPLLRAEDRRVLPREDQRMVARTGGPLPRLGHGHDRTGPQIPDTHARRCGPLDGLRPGPRHLEERAGRGPHRLGLRPVSYHLYPTFCTERRGGAGSPYLGRQVRRKVPDPARYAALRLALRGEREMEASRPLHVLLLGRGSRASFCTAGHWALYARLRGGARGGEFTPESSLDKNGS